MYHIILGKERSRVLSWGDELVRKVLAKVLTAWDKPPPNQTHVQKLGTLAHICNPNTWKRETSGSLGLNYLVSLAWLAPSPSPGRDPVFTHTHIPLPPPPTTTTKIETKQTNKTKQSWGCSLDSISTDAHIHVPQYTSAHTQPNTCVYVQITCTCTYTNKNFKV